MPRISTRIESFDKDIDVILRDDLSPQARSRAFGQFAREVIGETGRANNAVVGRDLTYQTWVDGAKSDNFESAQHTIAAEWDLLTDSFEWIEEQLIIHSPRGPGKNGHYGESHIFLADGVKADPAKPPPDMTEGVFLNTKIYSRKLEKLYAVYEAVAALAAGRVGNSTSVKYTFVNYDGERQPAILLKPR